MMVGHISPEAAEGGPIAVVKEGDTIRIDIEKRKLELLVDDSEVKERLSNLKERAPKYERGAFYRYSLSVTSASRGAVLSTSKLKKESEGY
ncbi:MAG: dihydroxy-acid dehydratase, partial [Candidatus Methanomethylicaceae archaeon]